ncbi:MULTISPECIES: hypothetical protein [Mycobacteriaceae]|uniref:ParB/Sulfiredoxin domain-containing protein n=1 Tax=Mycobacteroides salmoniphilum TaxID=404941 RepID=A0A4R8SL81_9MYCO|nr:MULTISPECIES: hypothetical protein [Mycobacteriaceae]QCH22101.1 hypothetical protein DSM43276_00336 [Mycobacteroides salmoniphilum]TDZ94989.1 hypothetical protein CCUG62472_01806 [Mycobacteroides salmoniphilum]TDZ98453.1 hypothetical protein CCUG60885_00322 [Mycobacteroides salmoniphilum]TEA02171.1 hypothetical protein CCUG60884_03300 [Mycobacteroides salmoniphilum]TEA02983.1 hypothetical protein CCUG60883_03606 [Mycobacteroides salmoniphilum]
MTVKWLEQPEDHDYAAAVDYLTLVGEADVVKRTVKALRNATLEYRKAKDILRAAHLDMLPKTNAHVARDLAKIAKDKALSPILLVRGDARAGARLEIADGYHRVCASYISDENTDIPCHLVSWQ